MRMKAYDLLICLLDNSRNFDDLRKFFRERFPRLVIRITNGMFESMFGLTDNNFSAVILVLPEGCVGVARYFINVLQTKQFPPENAFIYVTGPWNDRDGAQNAGKEFFKGQETELLAALEKVLANRVETR